MALFCIDYSCDNVVAACNHLSRFSQSSVTCLSLGIHHDVSNTDRMVERQPSFRERASQCRDQLQQIKNIATQTLQSQRTPSTARRALLEAVERGINDRLRKLEAWSTEFAKASQTKDQDVIAQASDLFDRLTASIARINTNLNARLKYRRLYFACLALHKR